MNINTLNELSWDNKYCLFPVSYYIQIIEYLNEQQFDIITYSDLKPTFFDSPHNRYFFEYSNFIYGNTSPFSLLKAILRQYYFRKLNRYDAQYLNIDTQRKSVIIQHDADNSIINTMNIMLLEKEYGIRSSNYFFRDHPIEEYKLDIDQLQYFEKNGFEIGYHFNAYELSEYEKKSTRIKLESDICFFKSRFNLRSFVPHGGVQGLNGEDNDKYQDLSKLNLLWAYNGKCILKDYLYSDGGLMFNKTIPPYFFDETHKIQSTKRAVLLFHPQYFGTEPRNDYKKFSISKKKWWNKLWE
jgi:hypothetical protein